MRKPVELRARGHVWRLKNLSKQSNFKPKSSRLYSSAQGRVDEPLAQIVVDIPGVDSKQAWILGNALGRSGYHEIRRPHAGLVSFDIPAHKAVRKLFEELGPNYGVPTSYRRSMRFVKTGSHRYELVPTARGATELLSKVETANVAANSETVLRFRYKSRSADQYQTVRAHVHGVYEASSGEYYFTATRSDRVFGEVRRSYSLSRASELFVENGKELDLAFSLRLSLYSSRNVTVDLVNAE